MTENAEGAGGRRMNPWRVAAWTAAALVLAVPLIAMQFTDEVAWHATDFMVAGTLVLGTGLLFELAVRKAGSTAYRVGVGVALAGAFLLVWVNGAVGIIGSEDNPANQMYGGVLALGVVGALLARFEARGMARTLAAVAVAQAVVAGVAIVGGMGLPASGPGEVALLNGFFVAFWLVAARLFQNAAADAPGPAA